LSIAAYNAGPGRVRQWIDAFGDPRSPTVDVVDWVERIPFTETRNYVQRVLENLQVYRLRIGNKALAFSLETDMRR
jgi:soluble lytic murein transglycosylase